MDESCSHCGNMTIAMLRSRYLLALPRSSSSASALHPMALLQVQAKALKQLLQGGAAQELRTATDLALRATKVTARALGQTMSTLVVQERQLWLTLADMRESDKHRLLDSPISQAGLFGEAVEDFPFPRRRAGWRIFCFLLFCSATGPRDAFSRAPCPAMEPGECRTTHSDPTSRRTAFRVGPLCSTSLPHRGYVGNSPGPACTVPGGLAELPSPSRWLLRTIRLGYTI